ncbi:bacillithiol biosynthesis cysteine-adding enzyme BshC [Shouchella hunanensis]|uniref:Putative cysteine ligase BshC n=1 Tax=Shouchella hunanensis TaxID=766894 RepID=A0ABY7W612_9BACI|nr:bacillithiol biosynthesis cysteine-adding enzyme BshC [Shouchella hunanensis]WDF03864.1 bacillithiol biosynthesis cysteine-adding enzyme BshC [Shouchella hunanensis]
MKMEELSKETLKGFAADYEKDQEPIKDFFSYMPSDTQWLQKRCQDLRERRFSHKQELVTYVENRTKGLRNRKKLEENLHKLKQEDALVVVGGQQAGLFTGPLYSVYKAMSIIMLAKTYERELQRPVVPLFWIAGEDHDLDEVRTIYKKEENKWKKRLLTDEVDGTSASKKHLPQSELQAFTKELFSSLPETSYTAELKAKVEACATESKTYVDFFMGVMHDLFAEEGLLYLDSDDDLLREIEKPFFKSLILQVAELQAAQVEGEARFAKQGYGKPIGTDPENAHLFYTVDGKRYRLNYSDGVFYMADHPFTFTKDELIEELEKHPSRFSNNVVTRPLMQEWLLPTVAFVAGPGELAYWGTLKESFSLFHFQVTPVIQRMSATIVPRQVEKHLIERGEDPGSYIEGNGEVLKQQWLDNQHSFEVKKHIERAKEQMEHAHQPLRELAKEMNETLYDISLKNKAFIHDQLTRLETFMTKEIKRRYETELKKYDEAICWLRPQSSPQERILNPIVLLNLTGSDTIQRLLNELEQQPRRHLLIYI